MKKSGREEDSPPSALSFPPLLFCSSLGEKDRPVLYIFIFFKEGGSYSGTMSSGKEAGGIHPYQQQQHAQYVGPYRLEKTLGKGQTGGPSFLLLKDNLL